MNRSADVAIVGAGIVGLAHAYMALRRGLRVVIFERDQIAVGASVRNFGLIWPVGQEPGDGLRRALRSRGHWREVAAQAGIWCNQSGSLHLAYAQDEQDVLEEFVNLYRQADYECMLISPLSACKKSPAIKKEGLRSALWSETEMTVNPREAIRRIPFWLEEKYGLTLRFGQVVTEVNLPNIRTALESWSVQRVVVCSGADFETLFPTDFAATNLRKCRLQMMKATTKSRMELGPSLCGGLTLGHYAAFSKCSMLRKVLDRFNAENPLLSANGIHILVSQNNAGELIIGDSHHYVDTVEPFDSEAVNKLIIQYMEAFLPIKDYEITERWHGVYPKSSNSLNIVIEPLPGVQIVNGLGGAGMTLSFGLAEEIVAQW